MFEEEAVNKRLYGIAFTDSVHGVSKRDPAHVQHFIQKRCRNWVRSDEPLDTKVGKPAYDCLCVSAGNQFLTIFLIFQGTLNTNGPVE